MEKRGARTVKEGEAIQRACGGRMLPDMCGCECGSLASQDARDTLLRPELQDAAVARRRPLHHRMDTSLPRSFRPRVARSFTSSSFCTYVRGPCRVGHLGARPQCPKGGLGALPGHDGHLRKKGRGDP